MTYLEAVQLFGSGAALHEREIEELLPPLPRFDSFQIEVTTWCNFSCQQCLRTRSIAVGTWHNEHIPFERFRAIVQKLPPTRSLILQGVGEPSMHPQFLDMIRIASAMGKFESIGFNTNAHTHDDAFWRSLGAYPLEVNLSIDSFDAIIAERCRSGTNVDLLWHRLQLFREVFPRLCVTLVASRLNVEDVEATLRRIAGLGGIPVQLTRMTSDINDVLLLSADVERLETMVAQLRHEFPQFNVFFNAYATHGNRCVSPFLRPYVRSDGYLAPCCVATGAEHYGYTKADDERDWEALRRAPALNAWIGDFVQVDPPVCQGCSLNPGRSAERFAGGDAALRVGTLQQPP